jgi:DNA polymerase IV
LAAKIEEIVQTDRLQRLENAKSDPSDQILSAFMKIYGVGHDQASRWIQTGYKTLDDLRSCANLTINQRLGIDHYDDFNTKIPRDQVTALGEIVKKAIAKIDPNVNAMIMGSYRRGAAQSGDIDLLLTKAGTTSSDDLIPTLNRLTDTLTKDNFLVASLAKPHEGKPKSAARPKHGSKWHGACVLPGNPTWRRIDFLLVPETEMGAALIYFTGDDIFNRSIRLLSSHKRMRLNQRGLYKDVMRGLGRGKLNEGTLVEGADEKKIFSILGVPWIPPEQRVIR